MDEMPAFSYHSGTGREFIGEPPPAVSRPMRRALLAAPKALFKIRFETGAFAPNHLVTIRNASDGWAKETFGIYRGGGWEFFFERDSHPPQLELKFVLDRAHWMHGGNLTVPTSQDSFFNEGQISFPAAPGRFRHGYDNFNIDDSRAAQDGVPGNTREDIDYDVIVIGSGAGGGTLADALSDAGVRTLVLEAGGLTFPTHITNLPGDWARLPGHHQVGHYFNEPGSDFILGVQMSLGGRSVYWSGLIPRMRAWELALWPDPVRDFFNAGGYDAAERLMRKSRTLGPFQNEVEAHLGQAFGGWNVEQLPRSSHQPFADAQGQIPNLLETSTGVFSTAELLLASMAQHGRAGRDNLTINLGHLVTHVVTSGNRATEVVCQDLAGNMTRRYRGKFIVLAAGSLESPRIALNSGLADPNLKIGVGLTDHPAFFSASYTIPGGNPFGGPDKHAKVFLGKKSAGVNDHPFNVEVLVNPAFWSVRNPDDDLRNAPNPSRIEMKFVFHSFLDERNFVRSQGVGKKLAVKVHRNGTGVPHFGAAQAMRNSILGSLGVPFTASEGMGYGNEGTVHHAGGTLRMSGDGSGVVDGDLKFEGYDNLYCADPSVWPVIPAANPVLTLAALCLRLAGTIKSRLP